jgi:hypothetical protein
VCLYFNLNQIVIRINVSSSIYSDITSFDRWRESVNTWSVLFSVDISGDRHVCLCIFLCSNIVLPIDMPRAAVNCISS